MKEEEKKEEEESMEVGKEGKYEDPEDYFGGVMKDSASPGIRRCTSTIRTYGQLRQ